MPSTSWNFIATLAFAVTAIASAHHGHDLFHNEQKREIKYSTITSQTVITTSVAVPVTINTNIAATGIHTIIPGALTMSFSVLPAYIYLETTTMTNSVITSTFTTKIPVTAASTTKASSTTSSKKSTTSSSSTKTTSASKQATSSSQAGTSKTSSAAVAAPTASKQNCGVASDGPSELGWSTSAGNDVASSWEDCYWICMKKINYCSSFAFAKNGAMPSGQECIIMKANTTAAGIWNNVGSTNGNFVLYDATCNPPPAKNPVVVSSLECAIPSDNMGGATYITRMNNQIGSFGANNVAECKAKCKFFTGYCASYVYQDRGAGVAYSNCDIYNVAIETPGAYEGMNTTGQYPSYNYDAGC